MNEQMLKMNWLSLQILDSLSYESQLGLSLKKNLHYFNKNMLISELIDMTEWLDEQEILSDIALDYRIKSLDSIIMKYEQLKNFKSMSFRIADMTKGKAIDDGYRGVHVYYQKSSKHYSIEIQFNTLYDRQLNNWLHDYLYKKEYPIEIGKIMRDKYEKGFIRSKNDFEEALKNVLSDCER